MFFELQASMTSSRVKYSSPKSPEEYASPGTWKAASVVMAKTLIDGIHTQDGAKREPRTVVQRLGFYVCVGEDDKPRSCKLDLGTCMWKGTKLRMDKPKLPLQSTFLPGLVSGMWSKCFPEGFQPMNTGS